MLAGIVAALDACIDVGVGADQVEVGGEMREQLEFGAADFHLADLCVVPPMGPAASRFFSVVS